MAVCSAYSLGKVKNDFKLYDLTGTEHRLYKYLEEGKSVILNFSSTWCKPCWNYDKTGILDQVYETFGPMGTQEIVVLFIEADASTCHDCLFGQEKCNDFTYGNWTEKAYPTISLNGSGLRLNEDYQVDRFPSIVGISAKDYSIYQLGQLSFANWNSWVRQQSDKFRLAFLDRVEAKKVKKSYFINNLTTATIINRSRPSSDLSLDIFPNPCANYLHIEASHTSALLDFSLYDKEGIYISNQIPRKIGKGRTTIPIDHLSPGVYYARIKSAGKEFVKKIILID